MTEDEARNSTCWRTLAPVHNTLGGVNYGPAACISSACMAWRWSEAKRTVAFLEAVQAHMKAQDKPNFNTAVQAVWSETGGQFERVEGYCGLAGTPQ